jgi:hypothetical protein
MLSVPMALVTAGAANAAPACLGSNFPAVSGGESSLKVSCFLSSTTAGGTTALVKDYAQARWHSGAARVTAADGVTTASSAAISSATGHFTAADVNHQVTSSLPGIPAGAFIKTFTSATAVTLDVPATLASTGAVFSVENSSARHVTDASRAGAVLTSATANFKSNDVGAIVTGTGIKPGTKINSVATSGANTTATLSLAVNQTGTAGYVTINSVPQPASVREITDAHSPAAAASTTIDSATAGFTASDVGLAVVGTGAGWPVGARIVSVTSASAAVLSAAATLGTAATHIAVIGNPDFGAPTNGSVVSQLGVELALNPSFVASSDDCANHTPEGFGLEGTWNNPGAFATGGLIGTPPSNSTAQIVYGNATASFAGYVVRSTTGTYSVSYPLLPTTLAQCATTPFSVTFTFNPITVGQSLLPSGAAAPNTAVVRGYADFVGTTAPANTVGTIKVGTNAALNLTACAESRQLNGPTATWACGQG